MNINLELYRIFYVVAKNGNMTKASEELHISQPAISQQIKNLENQLGGTLFLRSNKGMELTSEGKSFYEYIKSAINIIQNAENEFLSYKELSVGTIKIGASTTLTKLVLLDSIKKFHADYPNIEFDIKNDLTSNLIVDLEKGKLDFVVFFENEINKNMFDIINLKTIKQGFLYNPHFYNDNINSFSDLVNYPLVLQKKESNSRKFLDGLMLQKRIVLNPKTEVVSQDLVLEFTSSGFGLGFGIVEFGEKYGLKSLKINNKIPEINVFIAKNKNTNLPFASKKFIEYLQNNA